MSLNAAALKLMVEKGLSAHDIVEIAEAMEGSRSSAAERQARYRKNKKARDVTNSDVTRDVTPPPNERDNLTPSAQVSEPDGSSPSLRAWACPPDVDPQHWRDFRKNRRTKRLTDSETAYRGQLKAIEQLSDDEWPPGRLVEFAAAKGWASINDPRVSGNGERPHSERKRSGWESAYGAVVGAGSNH